MYSSERLVDSRGATFAIRRLGALVLAKRLGDFADVARRAPRVVVYAGTSKLETRLDKTWAKGYAVGFQDLIRFVMAQVPQSEGIEDGLRRQVKLVPEIVVRELVANALIHQDLTVGGASVMVEVFSNRVEITNRGEPVVPVERFIDGYQSRNERLADLMRRMGICEEKSSGIDRVVHAVEDQQLPAPDFRAGHRRTLRYAGVLAAASPWRPKMAPKPPTEEPAAASAEPDRTGPAGGYRPWAELLARTFAVDVLACPNCHGRMRLPQTA